MQAFAEGPGVLNNGSVSPLVLGVGKGAEAEVTHPSCEVVRVGLGLELDLVPALLQSFVRLSVQALVLLLPL